MSRGRIVRAARAILPPPGIAQAFVGPEDVHAIKAALLLVLAAVAVLAALASCGK